MATAGRSAAGRCGKKAPPPADAVSGAHTCFGRWGRGFVDSCRANSRHTSLHRRSQSRTKTALRRSTQRTIRRRNQTPVRAKSRRRWDAFSMTACSTNRLLTNFLYREGGVSPLGLRRSLPLGGGIRDHYHPGHWSTGRRRMIVQLTGRLMCEG